MDRQVLTEHLFTKGWQVVCLGVGMASVRAGICASGLGEEHVIGYLSPLVFCLLFLGEHRIHVTASYKQGLLCELVADPGQEFLRTRY